MSIETLTMTEVPEFDEIRNHVSRLVQDSNGIINRMYDDSGRLDPNVAIVQNLDAMNSLLLLIAMELEVLNRKIKSDRKLKSE